METKNNAADRRQTGRNRKTITVIDAAAAVLLGLALIFFSSASFPILVIILYILYTVRRHRHRKNEAPLPPQKECELCGIKTDTLIPVHRKDGEILVCEECFRANAFRKADEQVDPVQEETAKPTPAVPEEPDRLIAETDGEREARLAALAEKKKSGDPMREELFLEDIEDEKSIRVIYDIWESYGFGREYPGIDISLARMKETGISSAKTGRLKDELHALLHTGNS